MKISANWSFELTSLVLMSPDIISLEWNDNQSQYVWSFHERQNLS